MINSDSSRPRYYYALAELVGGTDNLIGGPTDGPMSEIKFADGISKPTEEAVQTKLSEMQVEFTSQEYARKRKVEYPSIPECVHAILDGELDALQEKRQAVKLKYPKEQT